MVALKTNALVGHRFTHRAFLHFSLLYLFFLLLSFYYLKMLIG